MTEIRRRPVEVTDSPEHRAIPIDSFSLADSDDNTLTLTGYASTFEPYEMYGGPSNGMGWIERIHPDAYERTLKESPDLHLLINHEGMPLARTKSGTLDLSVDERGLKVVARLDRSDPDVQRLEPKMRRGDMDEMSFAFRVKSQEWKSTPEFGDDPQALRTITELSLHKGDVSVVNFGANPTTHAELKSIPDALRVLAECDPGELVEARADDDILQRAKDKLANVGILDSAGDDLLAPARSGITVDVHAKLKGVGFYTPDQIRALELRAANVNDVRTLIASLDAVLDEVIDLIADADIRALPEKVAQALDLVRGAETIVGKLMDVAGIYDPDNKDDDEGTDTYDAGRMNPDNTEKRESVSDHPWDFPQSAYTPEQWRHACLIDTGKGDPDSKGRYREPVREPDGTLNGRGVHAAAGRLDQVDGISDEQRTLAAKKLVSLYRDQLHEDPPPHLLELAHERSASDDLSNALQELLDATRSLTAAVAELSQREDTEELDDDEMCADDDDEEEALSDDEAEENSDRGMSLSEARSQENSLSLAELLTLE